MVRRAPSKPALDSHQYEAVESEVFRGHVAQRFFSDRGKFWTTAKTREAVKWSLAWAIGAATAVVGLSITFFTKLLTEAKFNAVKSVIASEKAGDTFYGAAFLTYAAIQVSFVFVAACCVYIEPLSAGSGIPEIKCFLNGINIPRVVRVKTLACKAFGVLFSVAGGLPAGKEGPMIHSGAVVGAGISQGRSTTLGVKARWSTMQDFRCDSEKRDFVACGAAAGVTAAFGAPIGGVLFAIEEGATHWSANLTWQAFFCAMMAMLSLYMIRSFMEAFGRSSAVEMFSFGQFFSLDAGQLNYSVWECMLFIILGAMGGLIGAVFNGTNKRLTLWRMANIKRKELKFVEALGVGFLMSAVTFVMPLIWSKCTPLPEDLEDYSEQEKDLVDSLVPFYCDPQTEYNEVASLFLSGGEGAIRQLFHAPDRGLKDPSTFSSGALFLFFVPYVCMACLNYGVAVPSGLFVPSLLAGASFGRLFGHLLHKLDGDSGTFADSGTYALVGAASVLGGMARMTISLTVILLEATGDMQYLLPLMLSLLTARWTGNCFNMGLYDIHIHLKNMPMLEPDLDEQAAPFHLTADTVMSKEVECLRPFEKVGTVLDLLKECKHNCFPVVDRDGGLHGTMLRNHLTSLIVHKAFSPHVGAPGGEGPNDATAAESMGTSAPLGETPRKRRMSPFQVNGSGDSTGDGDEGGDWVGGGGGGGWVGGGGGGGDGGREREAIDVEASEGMLNPAPLVNHVVLESVYPRYPAAEDVEVSDEEREYWIDLRPYCNNAPYTISAGASVQRTYFMFRKLGLRHLCVVDHRMRLVGLITRENLLEHRIEYHASAQHDRLLDGEMSDEE